MLLLKTIVVLLLGLGALYMSFFKEMIIIPLVMGIVAIILKKFMVKNGEKNFFLTIGSYAGAIAIGISLVDLFVNVASKIMH